MEKFEIIWTKSATFDLEDIIKYIKCDSKDKAKQIFYEIKAICDDLYYFPKRNRIVPELMNISIAKYREIIHKRWRIIYKIDDQKVYILALIDASRNLEDILLKRLLKDKT